MFELRHLQVFREVARLGSLSAAAESLAYTQPAVSQQMAALERRAGMPLLDRTTRGVRLTDAGEALLRHADAILAEQTLAERELEAIAGLRGGRVRMASFPTAGAALVPAAVSLFSARYPDVELSVLEAEPEESVPMLRAGELEVAIVGTVRNRPTGSETCTTESTSTTCSTSRATRFSRPTIGSPAANGCGSRTSPAKCGSSSPAAPPGRAAIYLEPGPEPAPDEPRIAFRSDDFNIVQGMVAAGAGIAVVPELALTNLRADVTIHNLGSSAPMRTIAAATLAGVHRSPATIALLELLAEVTEAHLATRQPRTPGPNPARS